MPIRAFSHLGAAPLTLCALSCGGDGAPLEEGTVEDRGVLDLPDTVVVLDPPDTLISAASGVIAVVSDLAVANDGTLYLLDYRNHGIHVVDPNGNMTGTIGREGDGPGEFADPRSLRFYGDTVAVVDWGHGQLHLLDAQGTYLGSARLPPGPPPFLGPNHLMVSPTWGADTVLAIIRGADQQERGRIGSTIGSPSRSVYIEESKAMSRRGEVPPIFLNSAEAAVGEDGLVWLFVPSRTSLEQYDSLGALRWAMELDEPQFAGVREEWIRVHQEDPELFMGLRYFLNAEVVGEDLWILLGQSRSGEAAIRVVTRDGNLGSLYRFPTVSGTSSFAVDLARGRSYFSRYDAADLLALPLQ